MALLKTNADESVMKKYLEKDFILPTIKKHIDKLSVPFSEVTNFFSEHIKLLSAQSYLVKYDLTVDSGREVVLRGNRISQDATDMWKYLYTESVKAGRTFVPTPLEYFSRDNFMLYEEFPGKTLRDFDDKYEKMLAVTPMIAKHIAWIHVLPQSSNIEHHTKDEEKNYWKSINDKIEEHLPDKPGWLSEVLATINNELLERLTRQTFTLCHNDFQASNLIYDEDNNRVGVIDFGNSTIYTPSVDIATYLVHTTVMTTKHLTQKKIDTLQETFLSHYFQNVSKSIEQQVMDELPLYQARVSADIIATTAVALKHTQNPYRILIPKMLLPVLKQKMELLSQKQHSIKDLILHLDR
jgi:aminoglycoside phosphotransferase (APT) family kinase protein